MTEPRELVVISGKGGTGKTSVVAAFAALAGGAVLADCDVDAADLHLVLDPDVGPPHEFSGRTTGGHRSGRLHGLRPLRRGRAASRRSRGGADDYVVDPIACEGCELCLRVCPSDAVHMEPVVNGAWMVSETRFGPLVHARLGVAEDNSGKLVTLVRKRGAGDRPQARTASGHRRRLARHRLPRDRLARREPTWCSR